MDEAHKQTHEKPPCCNIKNNYHQPDCKNLKEFKQFMESLDDKGIVKQQEADDDDFDIDAFMNQDDEVFDFG